MKIKIVQVEEDQELQKLWIRTLKIALCNSFLFLMAYPIAHLLAALHMISNY